MVLIEGDLLKAKADVICHQVNLQGVMGGGLAYAIASKFPNVNEVYENYEPKELGEVCFGDTDYFVIANCFSQTVDFDTDYKALESCLRKVKRYMTKKGYKTVAIPYGYGCGIANGDWGTVLKIFNKVFKNMELKIYKKQRF